MSTSRTRSFATSEVVPAGTGDGHLPEIFQKLDASGYHGFLSLEPHLANFSGLFAALEHNAAIRTENNTEKAFCVAWEAFQKVLDNIKELPIRQLFFVASYLTELNLYSSLIRRSLSAVFLIDF